MPGGAGLHASSGERKLITIFIVLEDTGRLNNLQWCGKIMLFHCIFQVFNHAAWLKSWSSYKYLLALCFLAKPSAITLLCVILKHIELKVFPLFCLKSLKIEHRYQVNSDIFISHNNQTQKFSPNAIGIPSALCSSGPRPMQVCLICQLAWPGHLTTALCLSSHCLPHRWPDVI